MHAFDVLSGPERCGAIDIGRGRRLAIAVAMIAPTLLRRFDKVGVARRGVGEQMILPEKWHAASAKVLLIWVEIRESDRHVIVMGLASRNRDPAPAGEIPEKAGELDQDPATEGGKVA